MFTSKGTLIKTVASNRVSLRVGVSEYRFAYYDVYKDALIDIAIPLSFRVEVALVPHLVPECFMIVPPDNIFENVDCAN